MSYYLFISPFATLSSENNKDSRHIQVANKLASRGDRVVFLISNFNHSLKQYRSSIDGYPGVSWFLIHQLSYRKNVSFVRFLSLILFQARLILSVCRLFFSSGLPCLVLSSSPPDGIVLPVVVLCRFLKVPVIVDILDLWPFSIPSYVFPCSVVPRLFLTILFYPLKALFMTGLNLSTAVLTISCEYKSYFEKLGISSTVLYLGSPLASYDKCTKALLHSYCDNTSYTRPSVFPESRILLYYGSVCPSYDLKTLSAYCQLYSEIEEPIALYVLGPISDPSSFPDCSCLRHIPSLPFRDSAPYLMSRLILAYPLAEFASQSVGNRLCDFALTLNPILSTCDLPELAKAGVPVFIYKNYLQFSQALKQSFSCIDNLPVHSHVGDIFLYRFTSDYVSDSFLKLFDSCLC